MALTCVTISTTNPTKKTAVCTCTNGSTINNVFNVTQFTACGVYSLHNEDDSAQLTVNASGVVTAPANNAAIYVDCSASAPGSLEILVCNP